MRLYSMFGRLSGDNDDSLMVRDVTKSEVMRAYKERVCYMRGHGFKVREHRDFNDNLPWCDVRNPITGLDECQYWIRETA